MTARVTVAKLRDLSRHLARVLGSRGARSASLAIVDVTPRAWGYFRKPAHLVVLHVTGTLFMHDEGASAVAARRSRGPRPVPWTNG